MKNKLNALSVLETLELPTFEAEQKVVQAIINSPQFVLTQRWGDYYDYGVSVEIKVNGESKYLRGDVGVSLSADEPVTFKENEKELTLKILNRLIQEVNEA